MLFRVSFLNFKVIITSEVINRFDRVSNTAIMAIVVTSEA